MSITYFAYGSNLYTPRLRYRVPTCRPTGLATLYGYELRFHKRSKRDGSAKCDAFCTDKDDQFVLGVLFDIQENEKADLDTAEGRYNGYDEKHVTVQRPDGTNINAVSYVAAAGAIEPSLLPYGWYRDFVIKGAAEHGLPQDYVQRFIDNVPYTRDPNTTRERKERSKVK